MIGFMIPSRRRLVLPALGAIMALTAATAAAPTAAAAATAETSREVPGLARVSGCRPGELGSGQIVLNTYGNTLVRVTNRCRIEVTKVGGPLAMWNPAGPVAGLGIIGTYPQRYDSRGRVRMDALPLLLRLRRAYSPDAVTAFFHHDVVRTSWGTYLSILGLRAADGAMNDIVIEFDDDLRILRRLNLNRLLFGHRWGARNLGAPHRGEDWLHTNSLDTNKRGQVLISLRNLNRVVLVDWRRGEIVRSYGRGVLSVQHHARFARSGTITVFNNGAVGRRSGIAVYGERGKLREYLPLPFFASAYGSVRRLPNGRWLTLDGTAGKVYVFDRTARRPVFTVQYLAQDWIPFHNRYESILYRALWIPDSSERQQPPRRVAR